MPVDYKQLYPHIDLSGFNQSQLALIDPAMLKRWNDTRAQLKVATKKYEDSIYGAVNSPETVLGKQVCSEAKDEAIDVCISYLSHLLYLDLTLQKEVMLALHGLKLLGH